MTRKLKVFGGVGLVVLATGFGWWTEGSRQLTWMGSRDWLVGAIIAVSGAVLVARRRMALGISLLLLSLGWYVGTWTSLHRPPDVQLLLVHRPLLLSAMVVPALKRRGWSAAIAPLVVWGIWAVGRFPVSIGVETLGFLIVALTVALIAARAVPPAGRLPHPWLWYAAWGVVVVRVITAFWFEPDGRLMLPSYEVTFAVVALLLAGSVLPRAIAPERSVAIDLGLIEGRHRRGDVRLTVLDGEPVSDSRSTVIEVDGAKVLVEHDAGAAPAMLDDELRRSASKLIAHRRLTERVQAQAADVGASRDRLVATTAREQEAFEREVRKTVLPRLDVLHHDLPVDAKEARHILHDLVIDLEALCRGSASLVVAGGLEPALRTLAESRVVPVELRIEGVEPPSDVARVLWYVAAEAIANAVKYAAGSRIVVELSGSAEAYELRISDDGAGGADEGLGSGLRGLRGRVEAAGGSFWVESSRTGGTCVAARIPAR